MSDLKTKFDNKQSWSKIWAQCLNTIALAGVRRLDNVGRLLFGNGAADKTGEETKRLAGGSGARVCVVVDAGVSKVGLAERAVTSLEKQGLKTEIHSEVSY